jgi:hypothetical protein
MYGGAYVFSIIIAVLISPLHIKMCISSYAHSRTQEITARFTGHLRIVESQYKNCLILSFWHLEKRECSQTI